MNDLEKKSFRSFLGLYIVSSFLFLSLIGYWYYIAQKNAFENEMYYKLQHIADIKSGEIIVAHMKESKLKSSKAPKGISLVLIDTDGQVINGKLVESFIPNKTGYYTINGYNIFVSDAPQEHLNIKYVITQSSTLSSVLHALQGTVLTTMLIIASILVLIAWILSRLFMKPMRQRVAQIEHFINDVTHELNTPITSLSMATNQALKNGECTTKTLNNISISTKQLYDIYSSLTYLNFSREEKNIETLDLKYILKKSVAYYNPLAEMKRINFVVLLDKTPFDIPHAQATLLFGNLIGNAIKYSPPHSTIRLTLKERIFTIKDEGIGIEVDKQKEIFNKFKRGTEYSGGFGVGLSIVKSICETYKIILSFNSTQGLGTEFKLIFNQKTD